MLEAQLDAARSQSLHLESKLTMLADYDQVKQRTVDLETERRHLLVCSRNSNRTEMYFTPSEYTTCLNFTAR